MAKESPKQQFLWPSENLELQITKLEHIKREAGGGWVGGIWELTEIALRTLISYES